MHARTKAYREAQARLDAAGSRPVDADVTAYVQAWQALAAVKPLDIPLDVAEDIARRLRGTRRFPRDEVEEIGVTIHTLRIRLLDVGLMRCSECGTWVDTCGLDDAEGEFCNICYIPSDDDDDLPF